MMLTEPKPDRSDDCDHHAWHYVGNDRTTTQHDELGRAYVIAGAWQCVRCNMCWSDREAVSGPHEYDVVHATANMPLGYAIDTVTRERDAALELADALGADLEKCWAFASQYAHDGQAPPPSLLTWRARRLP